MWRQGLHRGNQVKMRSLGWFLIPYDQYPYTNGKTVFQSQKVIEKRPCEETQGKSHLQAKERDQEQILPSQISERTNPVNTLILDF